MPPASTDTPNADLLYAIGVTGGDERLAELGRLVDDAADPIKDLAEPDAISAAVGRVGYFASYTAPECELPADDGEHGEPAEFDRYYFPVDGAGPVLVDLVPGGSDHERAQQERDRHVAFKRKWCESLGIAYMVVVGSTW
jgi:hypothetical protein